MVFALAACGEKDDPRSLAKRYYELSVKRDDGSATAQELEKWGKIRRKRQRWAKEFIEKMNSGKGVNMANDPSTIFEGTLEKLQSGELTLDNPARTTRTEPQKTAVPSREAASAEDAPEGTPQTIGGGIKYYIYRGNDLLRVRSEPDTSTDNIVTRLADGDRVALLETGKTASMDGISAPWLKIKTADGNTGWVFSGYLIAETANNANAENAGTTMPANANAAPESDFSVGLTASGKGVVITGYTGSGGAVVIPAKIHGYPVREIGKSAFKDRPALTSVTIPDGVTEIGEEAFEGCRGLTAVTIPGSVTTIGERAFYDCAGLAAVTIPGSVKTIGRWAFSNCSRLASVTISNGVTEIYSGAFSYCTSLASITIPDSVKSIEIGTFSGCANLATVTISPVAGREWGISSEYIPPADIFDECHKLSLASQAALRAAGYKGSF